MCGASVISLHTKSHCPSPCIHMRHSPAALIPISGPLAFLALIRLFEPSSSNATSPYLVPSLSRHWASCTEVGVPVLTKGQLLDDNLVFCSENHRNNRRLVLLMLLCIIKQRLHLPQGRYLWVLCQWCSPVPLLLVPALPFQGGWSYQNFLGSPTEAWGSIRMVVTTCLHRWFQTIWKTQGFTEKLPVQLMAKLTRRVLLIYWFPSSLSTFKIKWSFLCLSDHQNQRIWLSPSKCNIKRILKDTYVDVVLRFMV